ncbi:MAG: GGDEF domain-containing protein [Deltaproteobacteria bacterium]|nr:GGDEF domain-containing protein [Deltaproteobacteria bacterium]
MTGENTMQLWQFIVILSTGIALGIILHPLARMIESEGINQFLDSLARTVTAPFAFLGRTFGRKLASRRVLKDTREATTRLVDSREQQISDTAQTIRGLLLSLASAIQRTDQAASDSSQTLGNVRNTIDHMAIPDDLREVHSQLLTEIDRVISSNSTLKQELFHSREILATQRQQIDTLKTEVRIDGMTQLANRTCFDEKLLEMVRLWERFGDAFTLLIIDVDNFKVINDTHGHPGGDRVLKGIAYKIRSTLRTTDFVARFGGDEFAAILMKSKAAAAAAAAQKVCRQVRESRFFLDGEEVRTSLSIGVAEIAAGENAEQLLKRADRALYRVKEAGRNDVIIAEPPV